MDIAKIKDEAAHFSERLEKIKDQIKPDYFQWYPYSTISNFIHFDKLLTGDNRRFLDNLKGGVVADIGAADGDNSFFMESIGFDVDIIDYGLMNYNELMGARTLKIRLGSSVNIHDIDVDSRFTLPRGKYDLVLFLGILYHLKNPFYALETLSRSTRYCLLSTRVAQLTPDKNRRLDDMPVAYLLNPYEANEDPTNYWIFSNPGLQRLLKRTGWKILDYMNAGCLTDSDPSSTEGDERAFCLLESLGKPEYELPLQRHGGRE